MKKWGDFLEKKWVANTVAVCAGVLLYMILENFSSILSFFHSVNRIVAPIVVGIILAYLIDPITVFFEKGLFKKIKKENIRRLFSVFISLLLVILFIVLFFIAVIPSITSSVSGIIDKADDYTEKVTEIITLINAQNIGINIDLSSLYEYLTELLMELITYVRGNLTGILDISRNVGASIVNVAIGLILCVYFLTGKQTLINGFHRLRDAAMTADSIKKHNEFWSRCHKILIHYIGYDILDGFLVAFANAIIMLILQMPYVSLISVIVGITNLLPTFGPIIGLVIGSIILLLSKPIYLLWFIIITLIIQTIDGYILKPLLFGDAFGVPPVWTLISIILGGKLFGIVGIILAIPFAAVISFLYQESFLPWLKTRNHK